jgi:hypothetical protein
VAERLIVHIGPRKTGTTYLQRVLQQLAPGLKPQGVLYPTDYRGQDDYNHVGAVSDLTHNEESKETNRWTGKDGSGWTGLAEAIAAWDGTAIISAEMIGGLRPPAARRMLDGLTASEVDVVITMRDLGRILPSSWQQHVRNTHTQSYRRYLERRSVERGTEPPAQMQAEWDTERHQTFWRSYAYGALVRRWQGLVGADRVSVVTLPPAGSPSNLLWDRFRAALAVDALPETAPKLPAFIANIGSTRAEAVFLHALNVEAKRRGWNRKTANELQQNLLSSGFLERPDRGGPLLLPRSYLGRVRGWVDADTADMATTGVVVHGDVEDLRVLDSSASHGRVPSDQIAAAGAYATANAMAREAEEIRRRNAREGVLTLPGRLARRIRERLRPDRS